MGSRESIRSVAETLREFGSLAPTLRLIWLDFLLRLMEDSLEHVTEFYALPLVEDGWTFTTNEDWHMWVPPDGMQVVQGWKIHVSFLARDFDWVTAAIASTAVEFGLGFKHVPNAEVASARLSKGYPRIAAGKQSCIYVGDAATTDAVVESLAPRLEGLIGPDILSSLRVSSLPIFARWGSFTERYTADADGMRVSAYIHPDDGLVPDKRSARFRVPDWVAVPECVQQALSEKGSRQTKISSAGLRVSKVLQFSTGGGVFLGRANGEQIAEDIVKEARPLVGFDDVGLDACERLRSEYAAHKSLESIPGIPRAYGLHEGHDHLFMVREYVEGRTLNRAIYEDWRSFSDGGIDWRPDAIRQIERIIKDVHAKGWALLDVNFVNFIVAPDGSIGLIDLETARRESATRGSAFGLEMPGFVPDRSASAAQRDWNAFTVLKAWMYLGFLPPFSTGALNFLYAHIQRAYPPEVADLAANAVADLFDIALLESGSGRDRGTMDTSEDSLDYWVAVDSAERTRSSASSPSWNSDADRFARQAELLISRELGQATLSAKPKAEFANGHAGAALALLFAGGSTESRKFAETYLNGTANSTTVHSLLRGEFPALSLSAWYCARVVLTGTVDVRGFVHIGRELLQSKQLDRSLIAGSSGLLYAASRLASVFRRNIPQELRTFALELFEIVRDWDGGDIPGGVLTGRASAGLAMKRASEVFGLTNLSSYEDLLAEEFAKQAGSLMHFRGFGGGLDSAWGTAAVLADLPWAKSGEFATLLGDLLAEAVPSRHATLGLQHGIGGSMVAFASLRRFGLLGDASPDFFSEALLKHSLLLARESAVERTGSVDLVVRNDTMMFSNRPTAPVGLLSGVAGLVVGYRAFASPSLTVGWL